MSGDAKLDLRTRIALTPNMEVTAKALAALAHSGKSPMTGPLTTCEDLGIHTSPIIAHADREIACAESHFGLNMGCLCMLMRVADRFACYAISLVTNHGIQLSGPAFHDYAVLRLRRGTNLLPEFVAKRAQRGREITVVKRRGAQVLDGVASLADRLVPNLHCRVQKLHGVVGT